MAYAALNCNTSSERQQHTNSNSFKKNHFAERPKDTPHFLFGFLHIKKFIPVKGPYQCAFVVYGGATNLLLGTPS